MGARSEMVWHDCEKLIVVNMVSECDGVNQETMYAGLHRSFTQKTGGSQRSGIWRRHIDDFIGKRMSFQDVRERLKI